MEHAGHDAAWAGVAINAMGWRRVAWIGNTTHGVARHGAAWHGMVWHGIAWHRVASRGMARRGQNTTRHGMATRARNGVSGCMVIRCD
eukprot:3982362-Lingulodinium_polyedra.AAC.1